MKLASVLLSITAAFSAAPLASAFVKGVNQPWGNGQYGHWFTSGYNENDVANTFIAAKDIGATWVRVWMFEGSQGLTVDGNGYITGMTTQFIDNFWNLLWYANNYGVQVYPTFFNYAPGTSNFNVANFFTNSAAQASLVNNLISQIGAQWGGHSAIAAWELYNELNGFANPYFSGGNVVSMSAAQAWVKATTSALKAKSSKPVSVSQIMISDSYHPVGSNNQDYKGLGLDFYNIHVYNDQGTLPAASAFNIRKVNRGSQQLPAAPESGSLGGGCLLLETLGAVLPSSWVPLVVLRFRCHSDERYDHGKMQDIIWNARV